MGKTRNISAISGVATQFLSVTVSWMPGEEAWMHITTLSQFSGMRLLGREDIDEDMSWPDIIAYAEAKWRGLQKDE